MTRCSWPVRYRTLMLGLLGFALVVGLPGASGPAIARQADAGPPTLTGVAGTVLVQAAGAGTSDQVGSDGRQVGWGDSVQVADDGEAALSDGSTVSARVFHQTQLRFLGLTAPDDPAVADDVATARAAGGGTLPEYQLLAGTTYTTATPDPDSGLPVVVTTPGASASSTGGTFLLYYDADAATTWVIVTDGLVTVTSASGGAIDVPATFATEVTASSGPIDPQLATRAVLGSGLPAISDLTNGALADTDVLAGGTTPVAVDTSAGQPTTPSSGTAYAQGEGDAPQAPALSDLGGLVPFPTTATLRAGTTTVWYWPQRQGGLETVVEGDSRTVQAGDGINVNTTGRAELSFKDLNVQIFRHGQLQLIPTVDANGYGLGYDLLQGATLNTVSSGALQQVSNDRIGVRTGWAFVKAVYTAHPTADQQMASVAPGDAQFVVTYDGSSTWVVVAQGTVEVAPVAAASPGSIPAAGPPAPPVVVTAGTQTWVDPGQPPVPPRPATRAETGGKFDTLENLTGGELTDAQVLAGRPVSLPAALTPPASAPAPPAAQTQPRCYQFTSTPIQGVTYTLSLSFPRLPAPLVTYWNPPANTWFYSKYLAPTPPFPRASVAIAANGAVIQRVPAADTLVDLSNGDKQSFVNFHYVDSQLDTAVSLTGAAGIINTPSLPASLPPLSAFSRTSFFYKPAGTGRVASIGPCPAGG